MDVGACVGPVPSQTVTDSLLGSSRAMAGDLLGALRLGLPGSHALRCAVREHQQVCNHACAERGHLAPQLRRQASTVGTLVFVLGRGGRSLSIFVPAMDLELEMRPPLTPTVFIVQLEESIPCTKARDRPIMYMMPSYARGPLFLVHARVRFWLRPKAHSPHPMSWSDHDRRE